MDMYQKRKIRQEKKNNEKVFHQSELTGKERLI